MKLTIAICFSLFLFASCKTHPAKTIANPADPQVNAGSCRIEATVVQMLPPSSQDTTDYCFKNSCEAIVHVDRILHCGSAATIAPDGKGEITVHFDRTIRPETVDPKNQNSAIGLKTGSHFSALVEPRLAIGDRINYVINSYEVR